MNLPEILILLAVGAYALYVIIKKVKNVKKGKYCSCQCDHCAQQCGNKKQAQLFSCDEETLPPAHDDTD